MSNQSSGEAYFDNLVINMSPGLLLEERHYYPYGLPIAGMGSAAAGNLKNKLRYQGNEYREEAGLNWMDFHNRQYDPQLGRFLGIDPMADAGGQQVLSPFHAMACNPVSFTDPMGLMSGLMNMPPQGSISNAGVAMIEGQVVSLSGAFVGGRGSLASLLARLMFAENLPTFLAANLMNSALNGGTTNSAENANQDYFISLEVDKAKEANKKESNGDVSDGAESGAGAESGGGGDGDKKRPVGPFSIVDQPSTGPEASKWDLNGDGKLSKYEADVWFMNAKGKSIWVNNNYIDWTGLKIPIGVEIGELFSVQTHSAFIDLPFETASTYGGTQFKRTGINTVEVIDQEYHYDLRPNNSFLNIGRNVMNEIGKPGGGYYGMGKYGVVPPPPEGMRFMIYYSNPQIKIK